MDTCELNDDDDDEVLSGDVFPALFALLVLTVPLRVEKGREDEVTRGCTARALVSKDDESSCD